MTYFELFSLPQIYDLDAEILEQRYRDLSKQLHPDRNLSVTAADRVRVLAASAELNQAYRSLKNSLSRAVYILTLHGIDVTSESKSISIDPAILGEILDLQDSLLEASADLILLTRFEKELNEKMKRLRNEVAELFSAAESNQTDFSTVAKKVAILPFYERLQRDVETAMGRF